MKVTTNDAYLKGIGEDEDKYSAFALILSIYRSNLSYWLKNDIACRILSHRYDVEAVSILLYDGQKDKLINRGSYIQDESLTYIGKDAERDSQTRHMLKYISFYDFLYYKYSRSGIPHHLEESEIHHLIQEFTSPEHVYFYYHFHSTDILTPEFVNICHRNSIILATDQINREGYYKISQSNIYYSYKRKFTGKEQHSIGAGEPNFSGQVFWAIQQSMPTNPNFEKPFIFQEDMFNPDGKPFQLESRYKKFYNGLEEDCQFKLDDKLSYCGIPLIANGRCIGIVRLLIGAKAKKTFREDKDRIKSLRHAAEILATFLHQSYAQEFVDRIVHDWNIESGTNVPVIDALCSSMRKAMNAFGCILRLRDTKGNVLRIVGKSADTPCFSKYVEDILQAQQKDGFIENNQFNGRLSQCFTSTHPEGELMVDERYRLVGVAVTLNGAIRQEKYFYCHASGKGSRNSEWVMETSELFIFKPGFKPDLESVFHPDALQELKHLELHDDDGKVRTVAVRHVLIMDIPALDVDGILTFANTANRPFNLDDARFAYGEMKRFGLELSKMNKERLKINKVASDTIFHNLKNLLKICVKLAYDLRDGATPFIHHAAGPSNNPAGSSHNSSNLSHNHASISHNPEGTSLPSSSVSHNPSAGSQLPAVISHNPAEAPHNSVDAANLVEFLRIAQQMVVNFQQLASLNFSFEMIAVVDHPWNIKDRVERFCKAMSILGNRFKGTRVWFHSTLSKQHCTTRINREIIELCVFNLLENAIKYSFGKNSKWKMEGYNPDDESSPGHVHVLLTEEGDNFIVRITNWGLKIENPDKIFRRNDRCEGVNNFLEDENPVISYRWQGRDEVVKLWQTSNGEGLFAVNKFIAVAGGRAICEASENKSTFTLIFRKC